MYGDNMSYLYIILGIILLIIILILFIPLKVEIKFSLKTKNQNNKENLKLSNYIKIYILRFIRVKKFNIKQKENTGKEVSGDSKVLKQIIDNSVNVIENLIGYEKQDSVLLSKKDIGKLKKNASYSKFYLNIGYNFKDPLVNAYMMAFLNSVINMYLSKNINRFNIDRTKYSTYISNKVYDIDFYSIINLNLVNTIIVIIKLIIKLKKVVKKNGKQTTSN